MQNACKYIFGLVAVMATIGLVVCSATESPAQQTTSAEQLQPMEVEPPAVSSRQRESRTGESSQGFGYDQNIPSGQAFTDFPLTAGEAVSPNFGPANLAKIHSAVSVVQNRGIYGQGHVSISDSITNVPGYYSRSFSGSPFDSIMVLRGFSNEAQNRTALVIDGVNTSIPRTEANIALAFPEAIERIEVLRGDGNVQFGNKTVGGAVNVVLKKPRQNPGVYFGGEVGSWGRDREWASINLVRGDFAGGIFMGRLYEDGWRTFYGDGTPEPTNRPGPWYTNNIIGNFNWKITPKITFDITSLISFLKVPSVGGGISDAMWERRDLRSIPPNAYLGWGFGYANAWTDPGDERHDYLTIARLTYDGGPIGKIELRGSHRKYDRSSQTFSFSTRATWVRWTDLQCQAQYSRQDDWRFVNNAFTVGAEMLDGRYMSSAYTPSTATGDYLLNFNRFISAYRPSHSYYVFDTLTFWDRLVFNAGYRRQYYDLDRIQRTDAFSTARSCLSYEAEAWNVSVGLIYDRELGSSIYVKHGQVFRMPTFDDTVNLGFGIGDIWVVEPEYGKLKEVGLRHWFTRNIYLGLTYYALDMNNEIYWAADWVTYAQNTNIPEVAHEGVEVEALVRITPRWTFNGSYTRQTVLFGVNSDYSDAGNWLTQNPKEMYHGALVYDNKDWGFSAMIRGHYLGPYYRLSDDRNQGEKQEGSQWGDLAFSQSLFDGDCTLFLGVNNFTDRKYALQTDYYGNLSPEPGRTVYGGLRTSLDFYRMRMPTLADVNRMGRRLYGMAYQGRARINGMFARLRNTMPF